MLIVVFITILTLLLYSLLQGAPYVPAKQAHIAAALKLLHMTPKTTLVDIGCGDGIVLKAAAEQGIPAVGIEINPVLWAIASWRCRRYKHVRVVWGNMWRWQLPPYTSAVFFFSAGPFMQKMNTWLRTQQKQLARPLMVVSLGFALPHETPIAQTESLLLYKLK